MALKVQFVIAHSLVAADKSGSVEQACRDGINECRQILEALQAAGVRGMDALGRDFYAAHELEEGGGRFLFQA